MMLGMPDKKPEEMIIREPFASEMRERLRRALTGEFTEEDIAIMERKKELEKKFKVIWK